MIFKEIISVTLILFSIIDMLGNLPIIIGMKDQGKKIMPGKATLAAGVLMVVFLFAGESILNLLGVDVASFAVAGAIIIFLMGMEMVLGIHIFKDSQNSASASIFPVAFPMIAGAGTLTTILSLRAEYAAVNIGVGIALNLGLVYVVLLTAPWIQKKIGKSGTEVVRKVFGIILLAIAVKLFRTNLGF